MKKHARRDGAFIITLLLLSVSGCGPKPVTYVAIREARFRCEGEQGARLQLPLTRESRDRMMAFFKNGGVNDGVSTLVDPEAEKKYGPVLDALSDSRNLVLGDDLSRHNFCDIAAELCRRTNLFAKRQTTRQVIDAREKSPPKIDPVAVMDDQYWWVFTSRQINHQNILTELLVTKAVARQVKR